MIPLLQILSTDGITPEVTRPDPSRVMEGDPVHTTWAIQDGPGIYTGLWQSTPGLWRVSYAEWEYCRFRAGVSVLTDEAGRETTLRAGDSFVIRPGFKGTWRVVETTLKDYVIIG